jgi:uncharacterized protein DUF4159
MRTAVRSWLILIAIVVLLAVPLLAQFGRGMRPRLARAEDVDGSWQFCRLAYQGRAWATDYPDADYNFSTRLSELTRTAVSKDHGEPRPLIVRPTDDVLFKCGFVMLWQAESLFFSAEDAANVRQYLLKGGFLFVSDYHGTWGKEQFDAEIGRALPRGDFPIVDLTPPNHAIWNTFFPVTRLPQLASIQTWRRTGGGTIERWNDEGAPPDARGIADKHGRLMVVMIHNTDVPDAWEREGENPEYFYRFSPDAYAVGIDILLYAMTH